MSSASKPLAPSQRTDSVAGAFAIPFGHQTIPIATNSAPLALAAASLVSLAGYWAATKTGTELEWLDRFNGLGSNEGLATLLEHAFTAA